MLGALRPEDVTATELAGEPITAKLTTAPGNGAAIGGLKVVTPSSWFAARPSGTEDVYKIYAESFEGRPPGPRPGRGQGRGRRSFTGRVRRPGPSRAVGGPGLTGAAEEPAPDMGCSSAK